MQVNSSNQKVLYINFISSYFKNFQFQIFPSTSKYVFFSCISPSEPFPSIPGLYKSTPFGQKRRIQNLSVLARNRYSIRTLTKPKNFKSLKPLQHAIPAAVGMVRKVGFRSNALAEHVDISTGDVEIGFACINAGKNSPAN